MPTARGWLTVAIGVALWSAGRVFGSRPLDQVGFALLVLVIVAVVIVNSKRHDCRVTRTIVPSRARAGQKVEVRLTIVNDGRGSAPLMLLEDKIPLDLSGHARFALSGIEPGGTREAAYELRPPRRGRYEIGPLTINFVDPFGIAHTVSHAAEPTSVLVYPKIEQLTLPRDLGQQRSMATSALRQMSAARGEDFFTLREYAEGDDLRKIHWPTTAKLAKVMIRQEETPWHTRATILLDDRRASQEALGEAAAFERCVEAAASLCDLYHRSGYTHRLVPSVDPPMKSSRGSEHLHRAFDFLAEVTARPNGPDALLVRLAELQAGEAAEGTLVLVSGTLSPQVAAALVGCRRRYRTVTAVVFPRHRFGTAATRTRWEGEQATHDAVALLHRSGVRSIVLGPGDPLAPAWGSTGRKATRGGRPPWGLKPEPV